MAASSMIGTTLWIDVDCSPSGAAYMERSYFSTMLLLVLHQIDAAYWREWEMFYLPGGVQGFLAFNFLAIPILLVGYRHVLLCTDRAVFYSNVCAGLGTLMFLIHCGFALFGSQQFHVPLSIAVIVLCLAGAVWLMARVRNVELSVSAAAV